MNHNREKRLVALLSVVSNTSLVIAKLVVGLLIGSVSVISEAIHSGVDLVAALIAFLAVSNSSKPSDDTHQFGHGKLENISGAVEALLIFVAAIWIIYESVERLLHPKPLDTVGWGVVVMLVSSAVNVAVSQQLFKVGRKTNSMALIADAWHLRTDVWTAIGVMTGLLVIGIGQKLLKGVDLHYIDPIAAIAVAILIIKAAFELTVESVRDLLDARLPEEELCLVTEVIEASKPQWCEYHDLRTRRSGATRFVEFHLLVDPAMSVSESHGLTDHISDGINQKLPGTDVNIHIEPCIHDHGEHRACSHNYYPQ